QKFERKHLTLRTRMKRLVRKAMCCSKSIQMHDIVIGLFVNRDAFGRTVSSGHQEHSVILTPFEVAVDGVQIPDRRCRYTWRSAVPTSHCRCTRTTMPQNA